MKTKRTEKRISLGIVNYYCIHALLIVNLIAFFGGSLNADSRYPIIIMMCFCLLSDLFWFRPSGLRS